jgi:hypothetical protein
MSLADELAKLNELHFSGVLSDAEFEKAKAALLNSPAAESAQEQLAAGKYQDKLARIDREWEMERLQYLVRIRSAIPQVPTVDMGIGAVVVAGVFGTFWTIMAISITGSAPGNGPLKIASIISSFWGVVGIAMGIYIYCRARQYQKRFQAYRQRRQSVRPDEFR